MLINKLHYISWDYTQEQKGEIKAKLEQVAEDCSELSV